MNQTDLVSLNTGADLPGSGVSESTADQKEKLLTISGKERFIRLCPIFALTLSSALESLTSWFKS